MLQFINNNFCRCCIFTGKVGFLETKVVVNGQCQADGKEKCTTEVILHAAEHRKRVAPLAEAAPNLPQFVNLKQKLSKKSR
mmetsp:Transcript_15553/g.18494  ORF Transcript_15553/g.18494 Transcript_15553/m.18494 type:complete len:81 (-) Transcript_15553:2852-3094(-)